MCKVIKCVSDIIAAMRHQFVTFLDDENKVRRIKESFRRVCTMTDIIGAIDCTHIRIQTPPIVEKAIFINRKGYASLNVQVVVDSNMEVLDIVARWPGSTHDSRILSNSYLNDRLNNANLGILLGDNGYGCKNYLITPFLNPRTISENRYNAAHKRTRGTIERLFGCWKRRFAVLGPDSRIRLSLNTTMAVIVSCAVLHNFCKRDALFDVPAVAEDGQVDGLMADNNVEGRALRQMIVNRFFVTYDTYFVNIKLM